MQEPNNTQSYNRYAYCLNNPLKFTDPSGYTWFSHFFNFVGNAVVDATAIVVGITSAAITTAATTVVGLGQVIFTGKFTIINNETKIIGGLFQGTPKQILSRFTKELPQTSLGYTYSQASNMFGDVKDVSFYDGATVVQHYSEKWGGITLGSYINGDRSIRPEPKNDVFQHEYSHYLQSQDEGLRYLAEIGIPSLSNLWCPGAKPDDVAYYEHQYTRWEQDANKRGEVYFGEANWNYQKNPIKGNSKNSNIDSKYLINQNPLPFLNSSLVINKVQK